MRAGFGFSGALSDQIPVDNGVKQGDISSPMLFIIYLALVFLVVLYFDLRPDPKMLFQCDAPEGSDTFQWPVIERDRIKADNMGQGEGPTVPLQRDAPEESDL